MSIQKLRSQHSLSSFPECKNVKTKRKDKFHISSLFGKKIVMARQIFQKTSSFLVLGKHTLI